MYSVGYVMNPSTVPAIIPAERDNSADLSFFDILKEKITVVSRWTCLIDVFVILYVMKVEAGGKASTAFELASAHSCFVGGVFVVIRCEH